MLKIKAFTDNLEPYLGVIAIICGSHAGRADATFGTLRLVLQVGNMSLSQAFNQNIL